MSDRKDWEAAADQLLEEGRRTFGEPPTVDELLAYESGGLSEADAERVRQYLVHNPDEARVLITSIPFPSHAKPEDPGYLSEHELARNWAELQTRIRTTGKGDVWRYASFAAAVVIAALAAMLVRTASRERELERRLTQPVVAFESAILSSDEQRGAGEPVPMPLSTAVENYLLLPSIIEQPQYASYRIELYDVTEAEPRKLWTTTNARRSFDDTLPVWVPRAFLRPAGTYRLLVYGVNGGASNRLGSYTFRLPRA